MLCTICKKEFEGRLDAKFCSSTCRSRANRATDNPLKVKENDENATDNELSVANEPIKCDNDATATPSEVSENTGLNKWDTEISKGFKEKDPLKRITIVPSQKADKDYWTSQTYKNLIEELETKSIDQLTKEGYFIPAWRISGTKKPDISVLMK